MRLEKQAPPLHELRPEVPAELSAVVARLLAKNPAQRFQTPSELAQALVPFIKQGTRRAGVSLPPQAMPVSERGTALGGNTSKILKARPNPAGPPPVASTAVEQQPAAAVAESAAAPMEKHGRPTPAAWYRRPPVLGGAAAAVLALGLGIWLVAGIIVKVPTKNGTLIIEVNEPDATVLIDGRQITVAWANGSLGAMTDRCLRAGPHRANESLKGLPEMPSRLPNLRR